jgi:hypothetical protein
MATLKLPFDGTYPVTQTYLEHVANSKNYPAGQYNGGIDYALPIGTPVLAAADGRISRIGDSPTGYGIYVMLDSPDDAYGTITTVYAHLERVVVEVNEYVHAGDDLGLSGASGNVFPKGDAGAHLHFEARDNGLPTDPEIYYQASKPVTAGAGTYQTLGVLNIRHTPNLDPASIVGQLPPRWTWQAVTTVEAAGVVWGKTDSGYYVAIRKGTELLSKKV